MERDTETERQETANSSAPAEGCAAVRPVPSGRLRLQLCARSAQSPTLHAGLALSAPRACAMFGSRNLDQDTVGGRLSSPHSCSAGFKGSPARRSGSEQAGGAPASLTPRRAGAGHGGNGAARRDSSGPRRPWCDPPAAGLATGPRARAADASCEPVSPERGQGEQLLRAPSQGSCLPGGAGPWGQRGLGNGGDAQSWGLS